MVSFERLLWRVCRGNVFLKQAPIPELIEDSLTVSVTRISSHLTLTVPLSRLLQGEQIRKSVFVIFFQGEQLKNRAQKICEGFVHPSSRFLQCRDRICAMCLVSALQSIRVPRILSNVANWPWV